MSIYKILMTDKISEDNSKEIELFKKIDAELVIASDTSEDTLIKEGSDCDAIINTRAKVTERILSSLKKCQLIVRTGIGVDTIDLKAAAKYGIKVANVTEYCINEVADHAFGLFITLARKIVFLNSQVKSGIWKAANAGYVPRLQNSTFGIFGFGNIAKTLAKRVKGFDMKVIAYDPYVSKETFEISGVKKADSLEDVFSNADAVSLHVPLTEETRNIVNIDMLKKMKHTAIIINTSRGPLINEDDLIFSLENKIISGAGLDVLNEEPLNPSNRLAVMDNVIITPHAGYYSNESFGQLKILAAEECVRVLSGEEPKHWYNKKDFIIRKN